jgi:hypothetical protein
MNDKLALFVRNLLFICAGVVSWLVGLPAWDLQASNGAGTCAGTRYEALGKPLSKNSRDQW